MIRDNFHSKSYEIDKEREHGLYLDEKNILIDHSYSDKTEFKHSEKSEVEFNNQFLEFRRRFPEVIKQEAVNLVRHKGLDFASRKTKISKKNLERWEKEGIKRKKGAGRKTTDPTLESNILEWVTNYFSQERCLIRKDAKEEIHH